MTASITRLKRERRLRCVPKEPEEPVEPVADTSYEHQQRRHILSRDWSRVLIEADRRPPFATIVRRFL